MDGQTHFRTTRMATSYGAVRTTTRSSQLRRGVEQESTWSELSDGHHHSPGRGLQLKEETTLGLLPRGHSSSTAAANDLTVWAQDLLELLDDSLAHMQAMQQAPRVVPTAAPLPTLTEESRSSVGSEGLSEVEDEDSFPALKITEVDDEADDGDSVLTASNSVSSGGSSSYRAEGSPAPYYVVDEEDDDQQPAEVVDSPQKGKCTEIVMESTTEVCSSPRIPTSGGRRGKTLYETLMNQTNARPLASSSPRPRISAFSLGNTVSRYSDDSSDEEKDTVCIEQIQDLEELEKMLNESKQYETRRRIRAQIRSLRKTIPSGSSINPDESVHTPSSSPVRPTSMFSNGTKSALLDFQADFPLKAHLFSPSGLTIDEGYSSVTSPMSPMDCSDSSFEASSPPLTTKMTDFVNGVNLLDVEDEIELHNLLDQTEDIDDRKRVRNRLREVMAIHREQREEMRNRREQERENLLRKKVADADEQKRRTLAMYDAMAKSAPAGGNKTLDVNILRTGEDDDFASDEDNSMKEKENALPAANMEVTSSQTSTNSVTTGNSSLFSYWSSKTSSTTTRSSSSKHVQHVFTVASTNTSQNVGIEKLDLIEEAIRARQRNCDETKMRTLAAFDKAARTAPAGSARIVDFNNVTDDDIREKENTPKYTATFEMRGGVPSAKAMAPRIAPRHVEPERDLMEEAIRKRQAESDERKRRTLAAYDQAARSRQAGAPVSVYIPQNFDIEPVVVSLEQPTKPMSPKEKFQQLDATTAPKGGVKTPNAFSLPLPVIRHNAATIKKMILEFCQKHTQEYKESECVVPVAPMARHTPNLARANISIDNFSTSWSNGLAFCALIHHFYPDAFDYEALSPKNRRHNFELAFRIAEEKADIAPLLDVEDMVIMQKPDWKCVFTYVQSFYRRFRDVD